MEQTMQQISIQNPSLLMLNDDCLRVILRFLELKDCVNLGETCSRLHCLAQEVFKKCKSIKVGRSYGSSERSNYTVQEFSNNLLVVGKHVASVCAYNIDSTIAKTIADNCTNLSSVYCVYCWDHKVKKKELPFRNLKELKVKSFHCDDDEWKNCFANNPGIEHLEINSIDMNMKLLPKMLPNLKSLAVDFMRMSDAWDEWDNIPVDDLSCLPCLAKFAFWTCPKSDAVDTGFLIELAEKLNLVELEFSTHCAEDTFSTLKSFRHLERLSIDDNLKWRTDNYEIPENTIFPTKLNHITLTSFKMSCSCFLSIVKQLKLLEEFVMGDVEIFCENDSLATYDSVDEILRSKIIARVAKELLVEKRKLKIIVWYSDDCDDCVENGKVYKYSDNLEISIDPWPETVFDYEFKLK